MLQKFFGPFASRYRSGLQIVGGPKPTPLSPLDLTIDLVRIVVVPHTKSVGPAFTFPYLRSLCGQLR